jgi:Tfp pilus assembly major pilin PilA
MLSETGDRRLAAMQTRNLMYEAAKQKLAATDAQMGVPELKTSAEQNIAALQHQQDQINTQFTGEAWQQAQRAAAAAAAAQRAAEEKAWQRQMDLAKLGMERDKLSIEQMKALGMSGEDIQKQAQHLGDKLADPKLAEGRAAVEAAKVRLQKAGPDEGLPGVGLAADLREKLAGRPTGATALLPAAWVANKVAGLSAEERVSRSDWDKIKLAYQHQITGSGASEKEREMINAAFEGARTPAEQRAAIANADAMFKQVESRQKAAVDPRALQLYENRMGAQAGIQPRAGNVSDERAKQFKKKVSGY